MLTRDISLDACILDLVDNAIDAAWGSISQKPTEVQQSSVLADFEIRISVTKERFEIVDNCGGISLDAAADYAFTFGRDENNRSEEYTVGVYGIGLKRAVFKLGNTVSVRSSHRSNEHFQVPIDVENWISDASRDWDFDIDASEPLSEYGVHITVDDLNEQTTAEFNDPSFVKKLRQTVARDYMLPLMHGLRITINGEPVVGWRVHFKSSSDFRPMRLLYHEGDVSVEIFAGAIGEPPDSNEPNGNGSDQLSGWYILCNGRVVVAADRSDLTVWGRDRFPSWHPQYQGFAGIAFFTSPSAAQLPMTTTKNGVDVSSALYRRAVNKMRTPTRAWVNYTNKRKNSIEKAKERETSASSVPIERVPERKTILVPKVIDGPKEANVLYTVPLERIETLAIALGDVTMPYREVGKRSFDYTFDSLVDEDDQ